ncbi:MAG: TraR/DksA C4-type zinc finger protein [Pseudomonadota bacterium]
MNTQDATQRLNDRKAELEELCRIAQDAVAPVTLDQQAVGRVSRIDAIQQQAMSKAQERARQAELTRIDAALSRIRDGDYGYCIECDEKIAAKRLELDPSVALCIRCAR